MFILYSAALPNSSVSSSSFQVASAGFSMTCIISSTNNNIFTHSYPVYIPISFSSLIYVDSKTVLNKTDESGHPCLVPDLRGNAFSFSQLTMVFVVSLSHMALC